MLNESTRTLGANKYKSQKHNTKIYLDTFQKN